MAEAVYKTELIRQRARGGPSNTSSSPWVWWTNQRLHGELDMRTPTEVETAYYADLESAQRHLPDKAPDRNESQADSGSRLSRLISSDAQVDAGAFAGTFSHCMISSWAGRTPS